MGVHSVTRRLVQTGAKRTAFMIRSRAERRLACCRLSDLIGRSPTMFAYSPPSSRSKTHNFGEMLDSLIAGTTLCNSVFASDLAFPVTPFEARSRDTNLSPIPPSILRSLKRRRVAGLSSNNSTRLVLSMRCHIMSGLWVSVRQ